MKENCAFQYAAKDGIGGNWVMVEDTDLITSQNAEKLWEKYRSQFLKDVKDRKEPEMALWEDMKEKGDYRKQRKHWQSQEFIIHDGDLYQRVVVGE